jgi:hypothetical protein
MEAIFWKSASYLLLRSVGLSRVRPYRVMVHGGPAGWSDGKFGRSGTGGLFSTRVVMATSDAEARVAATALVRDAVHRIDGTSKEVPIPFDVEESNEVDGVVWRQPQGFSFYEEE